MVQAHKSRKKINKIEEVNKAGQAKLLSFWNGPCGVRSREVGTKPRHSWKTTPGGIKPSGAAEAAHRLKIRIIPVTLHLSQLLQ